VTLHGEQLKTDFRVINTDAKPFEFTTALHTYIEVLDVKKAKVRHMKQTGTSCSSRHSRGGSRRRAGQPCSASKLTPPASCRG
jgi:D-hexose-6-phosphate mutarotase